MATKKQSGNVTAMRLRRGRDRGAIAAIDLGASKATCIIARVSAEQSSGQSSAEIIGVGRHGAPMRAGGGIAVDDAEFGLTRAIEGAERMANTRIDEAYVAAPGRYLHSRRIGVDLEIADGVITREDVKNTLREGGVLAASPECAILHAMPIAYHVDSECAFDDPVGLSGSVLSTELLGLSMRESARDNLAALVERCGLSAKAFIAAPMAAGESCLIEDERELGVLLIDIGASATNFAVYDDGALIECGGVAIGGANITKDIAQIFGAPLSQAERIKTFHGAALMGSGDEHRFIDFPQMGEGGESLRASRADLCEVIIPRMEEVFELVDARISRNMRMRSGLRRAVITGGGSLLLGAREVAEKVLGMKTRTGRPITLPGAPDAATAPGFAVCAGVIQFVVNNAASEKFPLGVSGQSPHSLTGPALLGGVEAWLRAKF